MGLAVDYLKGRVRLILALMSYYNSIDLEKHFLNCSLR